MGGGRLPIAHCFLGISHSMGVWLHQAMATGQKGLPPHTRAQHCKQFKLYVAFMMLLHCRTWDSTSSVPCVFRIFSRECIVISSCE